MGTHDMRSLSNCLLVVLTFFSFLLTSKRSAAESNGPVVVVEISGDLQDADALREAIGAELHATAVAPDDPRASSARGSLTIDARGEDRRMSATYRSLGSPVSRTVDLPEDPERARSVAVLLAGNVARREADELLGAMRPAHPSPVPSPPPPPPGDDKAELERLRTLFGDLAVDERRGRIASGVAYLGVGALSLGVGAYYVSRSDLTFTRNAGGLLLILGTIDTVAGIVRLASTFPYQRIHEDMERRVRQGEQPSKIVASAELQWAQAAREAKSGRALGGGVAIGLGSSLLAYGVARPAFAKDEDREDPTAPWAVAVLGTAAIVVGFQRMFVPTDVEQTWDTYRTHKDIPRAASALRPVFGIAPTPGGASVAAGFTF